MKKDARNIILYFLLIFILDFFPLASIQSQCSICTRTAQQMGEKPARGLNAGIMYLAFAPMLIIGFVAFKWWHKNKTTETE